ncbi:hypothetical protein F4604DRAFT_2016709 [Suillus subluteus]|nr:hypothetical protein F4604DRAFT_2016709 [Suillus subluteus]
MDKGLEVRMCIRKASGKRGNIIGRRSRIWDMTTSVFGHSDARLPTVCDVIHCCTIAHDHIFMHAGTHHLCRPNPSRRTSTHHGTQSDLSPTPAHSHEHSATRRVSEPNAWISKEPGGKGGDGGEEWREGDWDKESIGPVSGHLDSSPRTVKAPTHVPQPPTSPMPYTTSPASIPVPSFPNSSLLPPTQPPAPFVPSPPSPSSHQAPAIRLAPSKLPPMSPTLSQHPLVPSAHAENMSVSADVAPTLVDGTREEEEGRGGRRRRRREQEGEEERGKRKGADWFWHEERVDPVSASLDSTPRANPAPQQPTTSQPLTSLARIASAMSPTLIHNSTTPASSPACQMPRTAMPPTARPLSATPVPLHQHPAPHANAQPVSAIADMARTNANSTREEREEEEEEQREGRGCEGEEEPGWTTRATTSSNDDAWSASTTTMLSTLTSARTMTQDAPPMTCTCAHSFPTVP